MEPRSAGAAQCPLYLACIAACLWICAAACGGAGSETESGRRERGAPSLAVAAGERVAEDVAVVALQRPTRVDADNDDEDDDRSVGARGGSARAGAEGEGGGRRAIRLSAAQRAEFGIELEAAAPASIETVLELTGEVHPNADRLARLVPRFEGIAVDVRKQEGDAVRAGDVLAVIESNESLSEFALKSPIDGTVLEKHVVRGESVARETPAFVIADLGSVWVDLSVFQKDLGRIRVGQPVRVAAFGVEQATGAISYVAPLVREATRTANARVLLANPGGAWRPGLFATGSVTLAETRAAIAVPLDAVQKLDEQQVVFVEDGAALEPRAVKTGVSDRSRVELLSGLAPGERFVARGGFLLRSELQKAAFEDDDD